MDISKGSDKSILVEGTYKDGNLHLTFSTTDEAEISRIMDNYRQEIQSPLTKPASALPDLTEEKEP